MCINQVSPRTETLVNCDEIVSDFEIGRTPKTDQLTISKTNDQRNLHHHLTGFLPDGLDEGPVRCPDEHVLSRFPHSFRTKSPCWILHLPRKDSTVDYSRTTPVNEGKES